MNNNNKETMLCKKDLTREQVRLTKRFTIDSLLGICFELNKDLQATWDINEENEENEYINIIIRKGRYRIHRKVSIKELPYLEDPECYNKTMVIFIYICKTLKAEFKQKLGL